MALSDGIASQEQLSAAQARACAQRTAREETAAREAALVSEPRIWSDDAGSTWRYVVIDGTCARIERCESCAALVNIPPFLEGLPVIALGDDALAYLPLVEEVVCPDTIESIGFCAFRCDGRLRKLVLPASLDRFDSDWIRSCNRLSHLVLPGKLPEIDASVFDVSSLRELIVGIATTSVAPGAFGKSRLTSIAVNEENPALMTDGRALYSRDGSELLALAVPGSTYNVLERCRIVAKKACDHHAELERIVLPEGLQAIEAFAFAHTGLKAVDCPSTLRTIGEKAFFNCLNLETIDLGEGLVSIGSHAFTATALRALRMPASIEEWGSPLAERTSLTYAGPEASFTLAEGGSFLLDEAGGLYRHAEEKKTFVCLLDPCATSYRVAEGTIALEDGSFAQHGSLVEAVLPASLRRIGSASFKACRALARADVPDGVDDIGAEAFLDTNLTCFCVPSQLEHLGETALVTYGAHGGKTPSALRTVTVGKGNGRFFTSCGMLLERKATGFSKVVICTGSEAVVRVPADVDEIAPYAFSGVHGVRELYLSDRIARVGARGLTVGDPLELLHIDMVQPLCGRSALELRFPPTDRGFQQEKLALGVSDHIDAALLFECYDHSIINGNSFDAQSEDGLDLYDRAIRVTQRLSDPVFLTNVNRSMYDRVLKNNVEAMCVEAAKHDDRKLIDAFFDLGYLDADNLLGVIDRVGALQDAAMTGHLLEAKRMRFGQDALDFDL